MKCEECNREMQGVCGACGKAFCMRLTCSTLMQRILGYCLECFGKHVPRLWDKEKGL